MKNTSRMLSMALCMLPLDLHAGPGQSLKQADQPAQEQNAKSAEAIPAGTIINGLVMVGSQVVGKYTSQGVLAYGGQDRGSPCGGTIDNNDHPQAFWFFSVNACGAYEFGDLTVFHTGHTAPVGEVTLNSKSKVLKVDKGSAMLLLVDGGPVEMQAARTASSRASSRTQGQ